MRGVMVEECEPKKNCNRDQTFFKAFLSHSLVATAQLASFMNEMIMPKLKASAIAAARKCHVENDQIICFGFWTMNEWQGKNTKAELLSALAAVQSLLPWPHPLTLKTGATSVSRVKLREHKGGRGRLTNATTAAAVFLSLFFIAMMVGGAIWLVF